MNEISSLVFTDRTRVLCTQKMYFRKITYFFLPEQIAIFQLFSLFEVIDRQLFKITLQLRLI